MINVQSVSSRADLKRFIKYPFKKYTNDPHWVPPGVRAGVRVVPPEQLPELPPDRPERACGAGGATLRPLA